MKKTNSAFMAAVAMCLSGHALANPTFYGSIEGGVANAHNKLPYEIDNNTKAVTSTDFGDGSAYGLKLGMQLDSPLFVELGYDKTSISNSDSVGQLVTGGGNCDVAPLLGLISDCWDRGEIDVDLDRTNIELIAGWTLQVGNFQVQPYGGLRHQKIEDSRNIRYLYDSGSSDFITQDVEYSATGLVVGARVEQSIQQFFWGADAQYAYMKGDNDLSIDDKEIDTPGGTQTDEMTYTDSRSAKSAQYGAKIYGGMKFPVAGQDVKVSLGYAYQINTNVLFTANTNSDTVPVASVGDISGNLRTDTIYLNVGVALK